MRPDHAPHHPALHSGLQLQSPQVCAAAIRAFQNIANLWQLSVDEQLILLGNPARSTWFRWKKEPHTARLERDTLERISYILGIYKALQILLPDPAAADGWIKRPNHAPLFSGQSALQRMLSGNVADLFVVRQYLDAQRGG
ncbi:antitoxin Xre/MbcA/ParS toxin-binding domain-containing protein [Massilia sp. W12]|uniref:MbcA/ParS/Xre antitoxin family protein n=1 Tax=Massilia sp. W12 TaxID=3126507 RepID=UPI0030CD8743